MTAAFFTLALALTQNPAADKLAQVVILAVETGVLPEADAG